ncbi:MAG: peptidylprolyl isomerase [Vicingaceae bacterium]|nr:peptidylprolyl isomerase [Vicingaceae bacterium]
MMQKKIMFILTIVTLMSFTMLQKDKKETTILISTGYGEIKLKLYNETPQHRDNFIKLTKGGFYNETLFHRIIQGFMIQGGDPDSKNAVKGKVLGNGDVGYTIPAEFNTSLIHKKGALAAARMGDDVNPEKASSGCQFYIVQGKKYTKEDLDKVVQRKQGRVTYTEEQYKLYETIGGTPQLDMDYTVFGEVIEGLDVLDKIAAVAKDKRDRPIEDVKMTVKISK